jgi:hypothetical protein
VFARAYDAAAATNKVICNLLIFSQHHFHRALLNSQSVIQRLRAQVHSSSLRARFVRGIFLSQCSLCMCSFFCVSCISEQIPRREHRRVSSSIFCGILFQTFPFLFNYASHNYLLCTSYVAMGDASGFAHGSPSSSPFSGAVVTNTSPLPNNVVFIDDIPVDFELTNQHQQQQQQQNHQKQSQQQQQSVIKGTVIPHQVESKKSRCIGTARCSIM